MKPTQKPTADGQGTDELAPVALFVYRRLLATKETVTCLQANDWAEHTPLYIFSDGGRDDASWADVREVRQYLHTISGFASVTIIERQRNYYLEENILQGIAYVLERHDRIIVVEDDVCTSPAFLYYMNDALRIYAHEPRIMHVSAFTNLSIPQYGEIYFTPHMSGWGWATWRDRWQHFHHYTSRREALEGLTPQDQDRLQYGGAFPCLQSLDRHPIPWDICWEIAIYRKGGLCVSPTHTLVRNVGIGQGTHFHSHRIFGWYEYDRPVRTDAVTFPLIPIQANEEIEQAYAQALRNHGMRYNLLGRTARCIYRTLRRMAHSINHTLRKLLSKK